MDGRDEDRPGRKDLSSGAVSGAGAASAEDLLEDYGLMPLAWGRQ